MNSIYGFKSYLVLIFYIIVAISSSGFTANGEPVVAVADGFATGTTGGGNATPVVVFTNGELRAAVSGSTPKVVHVGASINLGNTSLMVGSNTTLVGLSVNDTITGNIRLSGVTNVIIQNLTITNPVASVGTGDGIEVSNSTMVFITRCTFIDCADGSLDIVRASDFVTVSWCRFIYPTRASHQFANLIGNGDDVFTDRGRLRVTMHHNWYDNGTVERMPRVRFGQVHLFNNLYSSTASSSTIGVGTESQILVENNYFENQQRPWRNQSISPTEQRPNTQGLIQWRGNHFVNSPVPTVLPNSTVFVPPYSYSLIPAQEVKSVVMAGAGNVAGVVSNIPRQARPPGGISPVVFPNPVTGGVLNIYFPGLPISGMIQLTDMSGRVLFHQVFEGDRRWHIQVNNAPSTLLLSITSGQELIFREVVIVR